MLIGYSLARLHASKGTWFAFRRKQKKSRILLVPNRAHNVRCVCVSACANSYTSAKRLAFITTYSLYLFTFLFSQSSSIYHILFRLPPHSASFCFILFSAATRYAHTHTQCGAGTVVTIIHEIAKTYTVANASTAHAIRLRVVSQAGRHSFIHLISDEKLLL